MQLRRLVILHGYTAHPGKHWFGWLRAQLPGVVTLVPALPDTERPDAEAWTHAAVASIGEVTRDTAVVGHSLGTVTSIRALGRIFAADPDARLGALALVAPFVHPVPRLPQLDPFTVGVPALEPLAARIDHRLVIRSDDDPTVPIELAPPVVAGLDAELVEVPGGKHFTEAGGWRELPALAEWLRGLASAA